MSENNAGLWEPVRPASNPPADDAGSAVAWNAARQAPYVQPQGPNPFAQPNAQAPAAPTRPQTQAPAAPIPPQAAPAPAAPQAPQPQEQFAPPANRQPHSNADQQHAVSARDLSTSLLLKQVKPAPTTGWRKALYRLSGRYINVGNSAKEQRRIELTRQVNQPLQGCYKIALLSLKGGVGKTTTTATLGSTFASLRGDRVIAVDANPDRGTLSQKIPLETPATVRNLLRDEQSIEKYSDVRSYTSQSRHRLEVLASDSDPAVSEAFSADDYARTVTMLEKFYNIVLTDCGTGLMHSAMQTILQEADALVVVSSGSVDGARSASATLDWLDAHGYRELVARSVAVVNAVRPRSGKVDLPKVVEHFEQRCRLVRLIPFDPHLEEGAEIDLERLRPKTRNALLELAAAVASDFPASSFALQDRR
ncbi:MULTISPECIES: MinD/ParA family protein [unclassified Rhodococcus (in: high G+C Gram-positive bacteria)]|uniref:MinD/ParA family ATP-binding protein n=1 Tax=unclassified Rhodococcus (in: high G+C Gram-positive bacteria) TaxID=192944 RepID=UPI00163A9AC0|nr:MULTISPECIES: MinD/ParA family protein [unclassified Rhodococcus (in: high G+C Gram-positive bacteria)]MBC2639392.1 MinD/ParA family protein [Rhodococcus sp. 3A]MBC2895863.1 MinD/ParA family protein [Rhodococcus sp. 4CII]